MGESLTSETICLTNAQNTAIPLIKGTTGLCGLVWLVKLFRFSVRHETSNHPIDLQYCNITLCGWIKGVLYPSYNTVFEQAVLYETHNTVQYACKESVPIETQ